jgi:DNA-binding HxlR family transcriptional regulator
MAGLLSCMTKLAVIVAGRVASRNSLGYTRSVLKRDYIGQNCSIARALEVVGERWTLLIVRDVFLGRRRFDQMQESLGIARNVLTDRLNKLVDEGILERVRYSDRPERFEYFLTPKGRDLNVALAGLRQWGDRYLSEKPPTVLRRKSDRKPVVAAFVPKGTAVLRADEIEVAPGPGAA